MYSEQEIKELSERVGKAAAKSVVSFVFFNNHWRAYAPRNALEMIKVLDLSGPDYDVQPASGSDRLDKAGVEGT